MVNEIILNYLRVNLGKFPLEDLKNQILSKGYSKRDLEEAISFLETQNKITSRRPQNNSFQRNFSLERSGAGPRSKGFKWMRFAGIFVLIISLLQITLLVLGLLKINFLGSLNLNNFLILSILLLTIFFFLQSFGFYLVGKSARNGLLKYPSIFYGLFSISISILLLINRLSIGTDSNSSLFSSISDSSTTFVMVFLVLLILGILSNLLLSIGLIKVRRSVPFALAAGISSILFLSISLILLGALFYLALNPELLTRVLLDLIGGTPVYLIASRIIAIFALALEFLFFVFGAISILRASKIYES